METVVTRSKAARAHLVLAHGAGAPMTSPFLETFADLLAARQIAVTRFNFPYMTAFQSDGRRRPPPPVQKSADQYREFVRGMSGGAEAKLPLFIGGKSMGGRGATLIADLLFQDQIISGVVCLGYPFHPKGKPDTLRTAHLETITAPVLIVQGERDALGSRDEVVSYSLPKTIDLSWLTDGDHDFKPRKKSGATLESNLETAAGVVAAWIFKRVSLNS